MPPLQLELAEGSSLKLSEGPDPFQQECLVPHPPSEDGNFGFVDISSLPGLAEASLLNPTPKG